MKSSFNFESSDEQSQDVLIVGNSDFNIIDDEPAGDDEQAGDDEPVGDEDVDDVADQMNSMNMDEQQ